MRKLDHLVPPSSVPLVLALLLVGNLFDGWATLFWVLTDRADESNPLMAAALAHGPGPFLLAKTAIVGFAVALLWLRRDHRWARTLLVAPAVGYAYVVGGHTGFALMALAAS